MLDLGFAKAALAGAGITLVYFYLFNFVNQFSRRLDPGLAQVLIMFSYFARLGAVGVLLFVGYEIGLDMLVMGVSFMVFFSVAFIYTQGRAIRALMTGRLSEQKE